MRSTHLILAFLFAGAVVSCGGSSSSSNDSSGSSGSSVSTIADIPLATTQVESDSGSSNLSYLSYLASTGLPLGTTTESSFSDNSSPGACEMFNMTKTTINSAALTDLIMCYVTSTFDTAASTSSINIYDGEYHIFDLNFTGASLCGDSGSEACTGNDEDMGPAKVRIKAQRDSDGSINLFELAACTEDNEQEEFIGVTIDGSTYTSMAIGMHAEDNGDGGPGTFAESISVSGTLNSNKRFTGTKTINMSMSFTPNSSSNDFWGVFEFLQGADSAQFSGQMGGSFTMGNVTDSFGSRIAGSVQLIDTNSDSGDYKIGLLAMGDGYVTGEFSGTFSGQSYTQEFTDAWDGDTTLAITPATSSEFYGSYTLPSSSEPSISFGSGQTWDCSGASEYTVSFGSLGADFSQCANLELSYEWINCYTIVEQGQGGGN